MFQVLFLYLDFEGAKNIHVLKCPDLGFWRMLEISDWGFGFDLNLAMFIGLWYTHFEGEKHIHILKVLVWGFGGHFRFLPKV